MKPAARTFLLTSGSTAQATTGQPTRAGTTALQPADRLPLLELKPLRQLCPGVERLQMTHVLGKSSVNEALAAAPWVDALLLDSGNPKLAVKEPGCTGVRSNGLLDYTKLATFMAAVWAAVEGDPPAANRR